MSRGSARWPVRLIATMLCLLTAAPSCLAAAPITNGRYAGQWSTGTRKGDRSIAFNVDDQGRAFVSDPRLVFEGSELDGPCEQLGPWDLGGSQRDNVSGDSTTASEGTPTRIRPNGIFSLSMALTRGHVSARLRLAGRFTGSGRTATGTFIDASSRTGKSRCARRGTFTVRYTGQRHLTVGTCTPPKTRTIDDDGVARIYAEHYVYDPAVRAYENEGGGDGEVMYACNRATGQRWFLAANDTSDGFLEDYTCGEHFGRLVRAGDLVLLGLAPVCQPGLPFGQIRIVDLPTGTVRLDIHAGVGRFPFMGNFPLASGLGSVVLAPSGSAAWIVCALDPESYACQVVAETGYGPATVLDHGDQIDPKSLTLDASTLSWRNNGETKTATLG